MSTNRCDYCTPLKDLFLLCWRIRYEGGFCVQEALILDELSCLLTALAPFEAPSITYHELKVAEGIDLFR